MPGGCRRGNHEQLKTHPEVFASEQQHSDEEAPWPVGKAVVLLVTASVGAAWMSEVLVGAVEGASHDLGMSKISRKR